MHRGLDFNLGKIGADADRDKPKAQRLSARCSLLPTISASPSENAAKISLEAEGLTASAFGNPAFAFPAVVGPFHYYDIHGSLQQTVMDFTAHPQLSFGTAVGCCCESGCAPGEGRSRSRRDRHLLAADGDHALVEEQRVEVQYAEASYKQARAQADAGTKAPIDANRSLVELQTQQQRLRSQLADLKKQKNALARLIGLPLGLDYRNHGKT